MDEERPRAVQPPVRWTGANPTFPRSTLATNFGLLDKPTTIRSSTSRSLPGVLIAAVSPHHPPSSSSPHPLSLLPVASHCRRSSHRSSPFTSPASTSPVSSSPFPTSSPASSPHRQRFSRSLLSLASSSSSLFPPPPYLSQHFCSGVDHCETS